MNMTDSTDTRGQTLIKVKSPVTVPLPPGPNANGRIYDQEAMLAAIRNAPNATNAWIEGDTIHAEYTFTRPLKYIKTTVSVGTRVPGRTRYQILLDNQ